MVSWTTAKTLLITFGPLLIPRVIAAYRSIRSSAKNRPRPVQPVPRHVSYALNILFVTACLFLLSTLPYFQPENIFVTTESRLQIPTDVLFKRLNNIRPLTPQDEALKAKLVSMEGRMLYLTYGPRTIAECLFCNSDNPASYLYYALPTILAPHILHIAILGSATSSILSGREGNIWRTQATILGLALGLVELYIVGTYDHKRNTRALRLADVDAFHWRVQLYRGIVVALADVALGLCLYLSSTNRLFTVPFSTAERLENSTRTLEAATSKLRAVGIVRSAIVRDEGLRGKMQNYWVAEGKIMGEVYEEREVVDGIKGALARLDVQRITEEAGKYADGVVGGLQVTQSAGMAVQ